MQIDLLPAITELSIVTKSAEQAKLGDVIKWPQRHMVRVVSENLSNGDPTRIIVLKARQLGISTITEALQFQLAMLYDKFKGQVVTHESKSNEHLLSMTQNYFDSYPYAKMYKQANKAANKLRWLPNDSGIGVITAKNLSGGRGLTIHFLHGSEVGFWPDAGPLMASLGQAIPKAPFSFVVLESTANGIGNWFQSTWDEAVSGHNNYTPLFFPWQTDPEYTAERIGISPINPKLDTLDDDEQTLNQYFRECRLGEENIAVLSRSLPDDELAALTGPMTEQEIMSRLAWRRYVIRNDLAHAKQGTNPEDLFWQEYPHRPSVAFISTGTNLFPLSYLERVYKQWKGTGGDILRDGGRHKFVQWEDGPLRIWKYPSASEQYLVAGDPSFSGKGDYGCIQVINRVSHEQVARFRAKMTPGDFGDKMCEIGWYYNEALLVPEINNDGGATLGRIKGRDYPNVWMRQSIDAVTWGQGNKEGWVTNTKTKNEALSNLKTQVYDGSLIIHDPWTFSEMRNYADLGHGQFGNANGEDHDDTVMALAIAVTVMQYEADELVGHRRSETTEYENYREEVNEMIRTAQTLDGAIAAVSGAQGGEGPDEGW